MSETKKGECIFFFLEYYLCFTLIYLVRSGQNFFPNAVGCCVSVGNPNPGNIAYLSRYLQNHPSTYAYIIHLLKYLVSTFVYITHQCEWNAIVEKVVKIEANSKMFALCYYFARQRESMMTDKNRTTCLRQDDVLVAALGSDNEGSLVDESDCDPTWDQEAVIQERREECSSSEDGDVNNSDERVSEMELS